MNIIKTININGQGLLVSQHNFGKTALTKAQSKSELSP